MVRSLVGSFLSGALVLSLMTGCDNPACFLAGDCSGGAGGGVGSEAASIPVDGEELLSPLPTLIRFAPSGSTADPKTPIVLVFSESMSSANLAAAFELQSGGQFAVPLSATALIGDGHMIVLFPLTDLMPSTTYTILYRQGVVLADRTGQALIPPDDREIGTFATGAAAPGLPTVVATWPDHMSTNESPTGEIDVVFSRPMDQASIVDASWVVTVAGVMPVNDPLPQPVVISGLVADTRAFRWRSTDASGDPVSLGTNVEVRLELSPTGQTIKDTAQNSLANVVVTYKTLPFLAPTGGAITSLPSDAIGIDQVTGPSDLAVRVDLSGAQDGDRVGLYIFGREPQPVPPVPVENLRTIALLREQPAVAPFTSFTFTAAEIDLLKSQSPITGRFTDGSITFAMFVKRGALTSPIKLLDVDTAAKGQQNPVQDFTPPMVLGFSTAGTTISSFRSDQSGIVIVGRANEALRALSVSTALGNNEITPGQPAPVAGASAMGLFVAAPVKVGVLTPAQSPQSYTIVAYDRALNSGGTITGQFTQVGQAANGAGGLFSTVTVEVVHGNSLVPVAGAMVHVHEDVLGDIGFVGSGTTLSNGRVTLPAGIFGATIVTVDARTQGFDLVTFDGVPTDHVSIPLPRTGLGAGNFAGSVNTTDPNFAAYTKSVGDTRLPVPGETLITAGSCSFSTQLQSLQCAFGPAAIRARELGASSTVVVLEPPSPFLYSALTFLKAFQLELPVAPVEPGLTSQVILATGASLDSGTIDPEERPVDVTPIVLTTAAYPTLSGNPRVRVEATAPGISNAVTVGRGIGFNDMLPANTFAIRAAFPGSCDGVQDVPTDQLGRFVKSGTIDADLLLRAEVVDNLGNRGGVRPRFSAIAMTETPPAPPTPDATPFVNNIGGVAVDFRFADTILDAGAEPGIHKAVFTDGAGTGWTVWHLDQPDAAGPLLVMHLPKVGTGNTLPLAAGALAIRVSSFSWPTFDSQSFLWSDVQREFDHFAHAASVTATPP